MSAMPGAIRFCRMAGAMRPLWICAGLYVANVPAIVNSSCTRSGRRSERMTATPVMSVPSICAITGRLPGTLRLEWVSKPVREGVRLTQLCRSPVRGRWAAAPHRSSRANVTRTDGTDVRRAVREAGVSRERLRHHN